MIHGQSPGQERDREAVAQVLEPGPRTSRRPARVGPPPGLDPLGARGFSSSTRSAFPGRAHIARDPLAIYRLYSDDFAYVAASRTLGRTLSNLFVPHNTHIVPAWRVLTWALVAWAGSLEKLPEVLAEASYGILVAVMLLMGRLVARETGRTGLGLAAMAARRARPR